MSSSTDSSEPKSSPPARSDQGSAFDAFEQALREALPHLYDPTYHPAVTLWTGMGLTGDSGWNDAIVRAIEAMKPAPNVPPAARIHRLHGMLYYRYVAVLTQEEAAESLYISPRHLRREQTEAIRSLALRLWQPVSAARTEAQAETPGQAAGRESSPWRAQLKQELEALRKSAPYSLARVGETIAEVSTVASALTARHGVTLETRMTAKELVAAVQPAALRAALLTAIRTVAGRTVSGQVVVHVESEPTEGAQREVRLVVSGAPATVDPLPATTIIEEMLDAPEGAASVSAVDASLRIEISLPVVEHIVVVVDDNPDMAHLYRRYTTGAGYYVMHVTEGRRLFDAVEACRPAAIVLDVMLPDIDGWALLAQLREHPLTAELPVIVCSVVQEDELALALGAAACLRKPIRREEFLAVLSELVRE